MAVEKTLSARGFVLASILDKPHGSLELVLKIMDLENNVEALQAEIFSLQNEKRVVEKRLAIFDEWPDIEMLKPVEIAEFVKEDGETLSQDCSEGVWRQSLSQAAKLDIRAVLGNMPKTIGLFPMRVIYQKDSEIRQGTLHVWVVPPPQD
jgi:hypothetical protein